MKRTLTINLGGSVFTIDEDAYQLLDQYLSNLRLHFKEEAESKEVLHDFELRINELFSEKIRLGHQIITIEMVEEVIKKMGSPEEIFGEDDEMHAPYNEVKEEVVDTTLGKKLFRDPDDKILGGVLSGLAAYYGADVVPLRIAAILLAFFSSGITIPLYLALWIIIPIAQTATDKLRMRGESVTIENIGKTVTQQFEQLKQTTDAFSKSIEPKSFLRKAGEVFINIVGILAKIFLIILGIIFLPAALIGILILIVVMIALFAGGSASAFQLFPSITSGFMEMSPMYASIGSISMIVALGIPLATLIYQALKNKMKWPPMNQAVTWTLIIVWIASIIGAITVLCSHTFQSTLYDVLMF